MAKSIGSEVLEELPHVIVVALLLFTLLFVATKFAWVHCAQIPQWCDIYCQINGHSQIAIITGGPNDPGMGDPQALSNQIVKQRYYVQPVIFTSDQLTSGMLNGYELVILDHFKNISFLQALTLRDYVNAGGNLLWLGNAATNFVSTPNDDALALAQNKSQPGYFEAYKKFINSSGGAGFGSLGSFMGASYVSESSRPVNSSFVKLVPSSYLVSGIRQGYYFNLPYVTVAVDPRVSTEVAELKPPGAPAVPAILDRKYVGRIVYVSFPVEEAGSSTLTLDIIDYMTQC